MMSLSLSCSAGTSLDATLGDEGVRSEGDCWRDALQLHGGAVHRRADGLDRGDMVSGRVECRAGATDCALHLCIPELAEWLNSVWVLAPQASFYSCGFPAMIKAWRELFAAPDLWFGFVQIANFRYSVPVSNQAQLSSTTGPLRFLLLC